MFRSKLHVDKHIADIMRLIKDEKERRRRSFHFAKLYVEVEAFEDAKQYLTAFLTLKDRYAPAHNLMGQIMEGLKDYRMAIASYKRSLELDDRQKDLLLKICELYCEADMDLERAQYWVQRTHNVYPGHETVFRLREKIYSSDLDTHKGDLEELLVAELLRRPRDMKLRKLLMRLYIDLERVDEAYSHCIEVEKKVAFSDSLEWYITVLDVFQEYRRDGGNISKNYHQHLLNALNNGCLLSLEQGTVSQCIELLHEFDLALHTVKKVNYQGDEWISFFNEMQALFFFHCGTLVLKKAQQTKLSWKEAVDFSGACYHASLSFPAPNRNASVYMKVKEDEKRLCDYWYRVACYRASQVGHMLRHLSDVGGRNWGNKLQEDICTPPGKQRLYGVLFTLPNMSEFKDRSYLMQSSSFTSLSMELAPQISQLKEFDHVAHTWRPTYLHHLVWIALQYYSVKDKSQPFYDFRIFSELQYEADNLSTASSGALSQLDIEAFVYAVVRTSALHLEDRRLASVEDSYKPSVLPSCLSDRICTPDQKEWWEVAYQIYTYTAKNHVVRMQAIFQRGIECIRLIGNHGLNVELIIHLAKTFEDRIEETKARSQTSLATNEEIASLRARASLYWKGSLDLLDRINRGQSFKPPKQQLFDYQSVDLTSSSIEAYVKEGRYFLACVAMEEGRTEDAIRDFDRIDLPEASYQQAELYKKLAEDELGFQSIDDTNVDDREKQSALLAKARDALYLSLDRTRGAKNHPLSQPIAETLDEIEMKLQRLESGPGIANLSAQQLEDFVDKDVSGSSLLTVLSLDQMKKNPLTGLCVHSTPRGKNVSMEPNVGTPVQNHVVHLPPSPDRMDAQIRSLNQKQDNVIKVLVDQIRDYADTLKKVNEKVERLEKEVQDLKLIQQQQHMQNAAPQHRPAVPPQFQSAAYAAMSPHQMLMRPPVPAQHAAYVGAPYREFEYITQQNYSPYSPAYPPPLHHYGYVPSPSMSHPAQPPPGPGVPGPSAQAAAPESLSKPSSKAYDDDYYFYDEEDDTDGECLDGEKVDPDKRKVPDAQLVQDWPYGNAVHLEGKATVTYQPQRPIPPAGYIPSQSQGQMQNVLAQAGQGLSMPGPGFFSSSPKYVSPPGPPGTVIQGASLSSGQGNQVDESYLASYLPSSVSGASLPVVTVTASPGSAAAALQALSSESPVTKFPMHMPDGSPAEGVIRTQAPSSSGTFQTVNTPTSVSTTAPSAKAGFTPKIGGFLGTPKGTSSPSRRKENAVLSSTTDEAVSDSEAYDDSYKEPEFEPIVNLPESVDLVTGEEGLSVLFSERAKLYRFTEKQWKERGIGVLKILHNPENNQVRIVMRRDYIHKVCANHYIKPDVVVSYKSDGAKMDNKVLTWRATDFADGEMCIEQFCCKFKTPEIAAAFKKQFERGNELSKKDEVSKESVASKEEKKAEPSLAEMFKPEAGSWDCDTCYVRNKPEVTVCPACQTPKPGTEPEPKKSEDKSSSLFKVGSLGGLTFGQSAAKPTTKFTFGSASSQPVFGEVTFGAKTAAVKPAAPGSTSQPIFGDVESSKQTSKPAAPTFKTVSENRSGFKFSTAQTTNEKTESTVKDKEESSSEKTVLSPPKFSFDGKSELKRDGFQFTFGDTTTSPFATSKPTVVKPAPSKKEENAKTNAFTNFSFTSTTSTKPAVNQTEKDKKAESQDKTSTKENLFAAKPDLSTSSPVFGTKSFGAGVSFTSIAASATKPTVSPQKDNSKVFGPKGTPVKGSPEKNKSFQDEEPEEYEPDVSFKPIVNLPEVVDLKTGEEDEEILFQEQAKLFRLDRDSKEREWKERGVGKIKILKNNDSKKIRILMRRDQVLKLCANHFVTKEMKLLPLANSKKAWCWYARDYAEEIVQHEQLAIRFKTEDIASRFKQVFEECQAELENDQPKTEEEENRRPSVMALAEMFQKKQGEWDCEGCYVRNRADSLKCVACNTLKPKAGEADTSDNTHDKNLKGESLAEMFKKKDGEWDCATCLIRNKPGTVKCVACETLKPGAQQDQTVSSTSVLPPATTVFTLGKTGGLSFGSLAGKQPATGDVTSTTSTGFGVKKDSDGSKSETVSGTNTTKPFTFTNFAQKSTPQKDEQSAAVPSFDFSNISKSSQPASSSFTFGSSSTFTFTPVTPTKNETRSSMSQKSPQTPQSPDGSDFYVNQEGEDDHIHFEPVVKLPEKVDIKTGEEDEEVLFSHRAKLFRFDSGEWKERGLGDIKILQHKLTKVIRVLMRRDQVLKICLNHRILPVMELKPMENTQGKVLIWHAEDFSEGELVHEQFAVRFKTAETACEFKEAFETGRPKSALLAGLLDDAEIEAEQAMGDSDVLFISAVTPTEQQVSKARTMKLPDCFYLYEQASPCPGCIGCYSDRFDFDTMSLPVLADDDSDVEFVREELPSEEDVTKAVKFKLPKAFYMYKNKPLCQGCIGCFSEDFDFSSIKAIIRPAEASKTSPIDDVQQAKVEKGTDDAATAKCSEKTIAQADSTTSDGTALPVFDGTALPVFGGESGGSTFDFASLSAQSSGSYTFGQKEDCGQPFAWKGAGTSLFGQPGADGDNGDEVDPSPDIHFQPLVQLPEVEVKTGEEDEDVMFAHRARLYRFDGQWKERGLGEMKILKHRETGKYRLLLRREQVFKLACNHSLTLDLKLQPMETSETALCWFAMDYSQNEAVYEQFAVKFKRADLAQQFKNKVAECQKDIEQKERVLSQKPVDEPVDLSVNGAEEPSDDDDEEEEDAGTLLFCKRVTMMHIDNDKVTESAMGELKVLSDDDLGASRVQMFTDQGMKFCNHIICNGYMLHKNPDKKMVEWSAKDFSTDEPIRQTFRVAFSSPNAVNEFAAVFKEGVEQARDSEIREISDGVAFDNEIDVPEVAGLAED